VNWTEETVLAIEQRKAPRKILKVKAIVTIEGAAPIPARTSDIGANGISLTIPHPLQSAQTAMLGFDLMVEGKVVPIQARAKVMYCIFSGGEFKAGFQFLNLDLHAMTQLARFMR
jgi:hypothetical protein